MKIEYNCLKIIFEFNLARVLLSGHIDFNGPYLVALSPDAFTLAVTTNCHLSFYDGITGESDQLVNDICNGSLIKYF